MTNFRIIPRREWGARYGKGSVGATKRTEVIIHTTVTQLMSENASQASEASVMRGMENFHVQSRRFNGIAYSFCITDSGRIYEARGWGRDGAHTQAGGNTRGYGIAFIGDGTKRAPSRKAWESLIWLIGHGIEKGYFPTNYKVSGHRNWWRKACPGDLIYNVMHAETAGIKGTNPQPTDWVVGPGDRNDTVGIWQQQLVDAFGASLTVDKDFGPITENATREFETVHGLPVNGYVSQLDISKMNEIYQEMSTPKVPEENPPENEQPPADVPDTPPLARHYLECVRYSRNPVDERIGRALGAALHLHTARYDDQSTSERVYLVGGQAVRDFDRKLTEMAVEVAGRNRDETLDVAVGVIHSYLMTL